MNNNNNNTNQWKLLNNFRQAFEKLRLLQVIFLYQHIQVLQRDHADVLKVRNLHSNNRCIFIHQFKLCDELYAEKKQKP